ncbi:MAG: hypothetical protein ACK4TA_11755 [Saprospiraceae bacterium]
MNAESFAEYLKNPSKLYQINYQELKSLALQYPYCQNLQWLLLQKSKMDGHKDTDLVLERTATGSIDRALLYKKMKSVAAIRDSTSDLLVTDEVLELPTLTNFRRPEPILRETSSPSPLEEPVPAYQPIESFQPVLPEEEELDFSKLQVPPRPTELPEITPEPGIIEPLTTPEVPDQNDPTPTIPEQNPEIPNPFDPEPTLPEAPDGGEELEKQASNAFEWEVAPINSSEIESISDSAINEAPTAPTRSYARTYQPPKLQISLPATKASLPPTEAQVADLAAKSVIEKEEVASETLALILARQGHRERAIRMYEQLILKIPEKSAYFAAQIQKLKQA